MTIARKRFGQHFLRDQEIIDKIIDVLSPKSDQHLIEIGPGQGALTLPLLKRLRFLEAIELDRDLILELEQKCEKYGKLIIYPGDVLEFDFAKIKQDDRLLRVFGNLPYNISTPLIFHLLTYSSIIADMLFMLQKEVANRLSAKAGSKEYGRLSVMVQYHCQVETLFDVSPNAFYPPPNVRSSMVSLIPYKELPYPSKNYAVFASIVKHAFGQRRKTVRNSLKDLVSDDIWAHLKLHSDLRAENLDVKDFVAISNEVKCS